MEEKKALRKKIKALKQNFSEKEAHSQTENIFKQLEKHKWFKESKHILFYWSMADEVSTHDFILRYYQEKAIYLPVINGDDLNIVRFEGSDSLVPGAKYGIPEPKGAKLDDETIIDVVIVPGVAFDSRGNRMGRGAGYYDRILKRVPEALKIALAYTFQMIDQVPIEVHDMKMDLVITPK